MLPTSTQHAIHPALNSIHLRIAQACQSSGRNTDEVTLLAVSKTKPLSDVLEAYAYGQRHFGENYLQDALEKIEQCPVEDIQWHFIGTIQSNKTKAIASSFNWVHTLDRIKIARRLNDQRPSHLPPLKVLIQVNISNETNKSGVVLGQLNELAEQISKLPKLTLCGLMCIPAAQQSEVSQRRAFTQMAEARDQLQSTYPALKELSMGMSSDLASAIACGSTIVRIGTDIFGARTALT
ncbi:MAG: YggS family pyridoxal phosphate-dependent enzyme [Gammaproteobacteria bacterium]|nr:YggS family pyridoxal phosphate-dependent enzyme [Gammaproteobacteria bacterium]